MAHRTLDRRLVCLTSPASMEAEQYQSLRLKLEHLQTTSNVRVIAVSSPGAREGKTVTAINLAAAFSQGSNARVLLIEADLRRPSVGRYLRLNDDQRAGLAQLLGDPKVSIQDAVQRDELLGFDIITAGSTDAPVHELFRSPRLKTLIAELRERYDLVVLDTPPIGPVSDGALLARLIDGLLLVVAAHKTPRKQLERALNMLDGTTVLGIVFNRDETSHFGYRQEYRSYFPKSSRRSSSSSSNLSLSQ